jgi:hypothetical protein
MKKSIIVALLVLSGCTTVPVTAKFPSAPDSLKEPASTLKTLDTPNPELSDLISNANDNYAEYYRLRNRYNGWINWYNTQKQIFESVK